MVIQMLIDGSGVEQLARIPQSHAQRNGSRTMTFLSKTGLKTEILKKY